MSRLEVRVAPGLTFRFASESRVLAAEISAFLGDCGDRDRSDRQTVIEFLAEPPPRSSAARRWLAAEAGVTAWAAGEVTILEAEGIVGWSAADSGTGGIFIDAPAPERLRQFIALALPSLLVELATPHGWYGLHAAAVAVDGRGILLPGPSGVGKSTIFRHGHRAGLEVLSDDLVWLRDRGDGRFSVHPFLRGYVMTKGAEAVPPPTVWSASVRALAFPEIADRESSRLAPLAPRHALDVLVNESGFLRPRLAGSRFRALVRLAGSVPRFRLTAGRRRDAVPALLRELAGATALS